MKYGLEDNTVTKIQQTMAKYPQINQAIMYGSRAKGNQQNGSDVDLTLKGKGLDISLVAELSKDLDDLMLPYTFDISIYDQIDNQDLLEHIDRFGKVFWES